MKNKLISTLAVSVLAVISFGVSQIAGAEAPLSWADCVSIALRNNPALASAAKAREASKSSYYGSYNGFMPQISLSNSYGNSNSGSSDNKTWSAQGSVSMDLFNMSQFASLKTANAQLSQSEANLRQISSTLRYNLRKVFCQIVYAQNNINVSRNIVKLRQDEAQLVALRYDSGKESKGNMLNSNAQLLQAKADLSQALRELHTAQIVLNQQLGWDDYKDIYITTAALTMQTLPKQPGNKEEESLLSRRPDINLQKAVFGGVQAALMQASSYAWPSLSADYSNSTAGASEFPSATSSTSYGLVLNYPLFGNGPTAAYFASLTAKNNLEKAKQDLRSVRAAAIVDIEASWSSFAGAADQVSVQTALLEAARLRNDEATISYNSGLMIFNDWEIIASARINQEHSALQAQLNAMTAEANWDRALGKQLER